METKAKPNRLLVITKYGIDAAWYLSLLFAAIAVFFIVFQFNSPPGEFGIDVEYRGNLQETYTSTVENAAPIVFKPTSGRLVFNGNISFHQVAWVSIFLLAMFTLYLVFLHQLRKLFTNFMHGSPFSEENVKRIRIISLCFVIFNALIWMWEKWGVPAITDLASGFVTVKYISFPGDFQYILVAIVIYILADIFKYGYEIQEDNKKFV